MTHTITIYLTPITVIILLVISNLLTFFAGYLKLRSFKKQMMTTIAGVIGGFIMKRTARGNMEKLQYTKNFYLAQADVLRDALYNIMIATGLAELQKKKKEKGVKSETPDKKGASTSGTVVGSDVASGSGVSKISGK
jgi:uncharacterized protein (DUF486 family)